MTSVIVVDKLTRRFGKFVAVDQVSFDVQKGEIFGYLGANGAGKSTTIRMLTGLLSPSSGSAEVAGANVADDSERVKASIGYMSQKFSLYLDLPVIENLRFFGGAYGLFGKALEKRIDQAMELAQLEGIRNSLTGALPGGIRQRLALGCALLHEPEIVFLDEPTAGVDPVARRSFWRVIRELAHQGTTVFVTTHYLDEAEYCARIGLMVDGRLVALDTPSRLKQIWVPEQVLAVRGRNLAQAIRGLGELAGVKVVTPFGAGYHLKLDPEMVGAPRVREQLLAKGAEELDLEETEPSLEDVFLAVVAGNGQAEQRV